MAFNGSGTFLIDSAGQPPTTGTTISSSDHIALTADLATGLSNCITKDGQTTTTATIPIAALQVDEIVNSTGLAAGTYAVTVTAGTNIDSASAVGAFMYQRIAEVVTVTGRLTIDATTAAGTASEVGISLVSASNFLFAYNAIGIGICISTGDIGAIVADDANNRASLTFKANSTSALDWNVMFQFRVL